MSIACIVHCIIAELDCRAGMLRVLFASIHVHMVVLSFPAFSQNPGVPADQ